MSNLLKKIVILGSTGSIGKQALEVANKFPSQLKVIGLSAAKQLSLLANQINHFQPKFAAVPDKEKAEKLSSLINSKVKILVGQSGLVDLASLKEADLVLNALVGSVGLPATLAALGSSKKLALANKESLVAGGELIKSLFPKASQLLIPVDSEHSAIFQCLIGEKISKVKRLIITASGGPFKDSNWDLLASVTPSQAVNHPRWQMGRKISVDSATLVNKGLEVIEAHYLFNLPYNKIDILIHPQSIVHSLVEFSDNSIKAQLGVPDMRLPIQYALSYPNRWNDSLTKELSLDEIGKLTFEPVDLKKHPCLKLTLEAAHKGKSYPTALSAANEEAVKAFLEQKIPFTDIAKLLEVVLENHSPVSIKSKEDFELVDSWARKEAISFIKGEAS
jgi:1-deoxy-D-xylulose-5-phosphate reductoisomerase